MGAILTTCHGMGDCLDDGFFGYRGASLLIRVDAAPVRESTGALLSPFRLTDELVVEALEVIDGWAPLSMRQERHAAERFHGACPTSGFPWPTGPRFAIPQRYLRARIERQWVLLQVAVAPEHRTMERVVADLEDSKDAAAYAHSFNAHLTRQARADGAGDAADEVPQVRVSAPVGCRVLSSAIPQLAPPGAVLILASYPFQEVRKFVCDGGEDFLELPHAFFHYAGWFSGGRELLFDLQGTEADNGDVIIIDPCLLRSSRSHVSGLMGSKMEVEEQMPSTPPSDELFERLHRRCGQLCKTFDPQRNGCRARRMCGLGVPTCGLTR